MKTEQPPPPTPCTTCHLSITLCANRTLLGRDPCCDKCRHPEIEEPSR